MPGLAQPDDRSFIPKAESTTADEATDPKPERSLLEEKELEAALQLLVERAQYITGATGTALALPQGEEMVCRASAGSCAPAIGARLQVRSGLTGESIARRQLLRCDNAETDPRVNLETCRALGIASIIVLPLLRRNGEVRGLFELFSDHPYAFEERDLTALERMADLTATALDLAEQRQGSVAPALAAGAKDGANASAPPNGPSLAPTAEVPPQSREPVAPRTPIVPAPSSTVPGFTAAASNPIVAPESSTKEPVAPAVTVAAQGSQAKPAIPAVEVAKVETDPKMSPPIPPIAAPITVKSAPQPPASASAETQFALVPPPVQDLETAAAPAVPEAMRRVQKCASCGFPVSEGRSLCLDCEKKPGSDKPALGNLTVVSQEGDSGLLEGSETLPQGESEALPPFLANAVPVKESWLADHVNVLAIIVLILGVLVAVVVFR